jgi:transcriptional regulator with XRE-family HTH domain
MCVKEIQMNSELLKNMREARTLTRREVASELGVTEQTIYVLETDENSNPTSKVLNGLAEFYNCSVDCILGRETFQQ